MNLNQQSLPPPPALPPDLDSLVRLVTNPEQTKARLAALAKATSEATHAVAQPHAAIAKLEAERAAIETRRAEADHGIAVARDALDRQRSDLERRAQELASDRAQLAIERKYADEIKAEASELGRSIEAVLAADWDAMRGGPAHVA
jgi:chromosome segregation ATPase